MKRDDYDRDLRRRQREHLERINRNIEWHPCAHDGCGECHGTGIKSDGTGCIHMLYCSCPKCSPISMICPKLDVSYEQVPYNDLQQGILRVSSNACCYD